MKVWKVSFDLTFHLQVHDAKKKSSSKIQHWHFPKKEILHSCDESTRHLSKNNFDNLAYCVVSIKVQIVHDHSLMTFLFLSMTVTRYVFHDFALENIS